MIIAVDVACGLWLPAGFMLESEDLTRARAETEPAPDVQIVGDSVVRSGLLASALGNDTLTVRNDGMAGSGPPKTYLLLARQFAAGRIPRALVIAHSPHTFQRVQYEELVGGFAYWGEIPELVAEAQEKWTDALYGVLTRFSYLLRHRNSFRILLTDGNMQFFIERNPQIFVPSDLQRLQEFDALSANGEFLKSRLAKVAPESYRKPFAVMATNDIYFRKILALAKRHGVRVFWITMPVPRPVFEARAAVDYEEDFLEYLEQFSNRGELEIVRGEFSVYPDAMFTDWLHLNLSGAVRFACELEALKVPILVAATGRRISGEMRDRDVPAFMDDQFAARLTPLCSATASDSYLRAASGRP